MIKFIEFIDNSHLPIIPVLDFPWILVSGPTWRGPIISFFCWSWKVYDRAIEFIRSIDFEIIRSFRWKYSNIQLKSFENENSKNALEPTCDPQWSHVTFLRTRFNISRRMTPISLMAVLKTDHYDWGWKRNYYVMRSLDVKINN